MKRNVEPSQESGYSNLPSSAGHEDNSPLALVSLGWERLADGTEQLRLECNTLVDFVTMPSGLIFGPFTLIKAGWDENGKAALYRQDDGPYPSDKSNIG